MLKYFIFFIVLFSSIAYLFNQCFNTDFIEKTELVEKLDLSDENDLFKYDTFQDFYSNKLYQNKLEVSLKSIIFYYSINYKNISLKLLENPPEFTV